MQASDENQRRYLNYINDQNTVRDNSTGQRCQVGSGSDQYRINNNRGYFRGNDVKYDSNADQDVNDQQWQEVEVKP